MMAASIVRTPAANNRRPTVSADPRSPQHLVQRTAQGGDELAEEPEDHVTRLVEDEVHAVDESQRSAARPREALG
jgi:hypothetical protein